MSSNLRALATLFGSNALGFPLQSEWSCRSSNYNDFQHSQGPLYLKSQHTGFNLVFDSTAYAPTSPKKIPPKPPTESCSANRFGTNGTGLFYVDGNRHIALDGVFELSRTGLLCTLECSSISPTAIQPTATSSRRTRPAITDANGDKPSAKRHPHATTRFHHVWNSSRYTSVRFAHGKCKP